MRFVYIGSASPCAHDALFSLGAGDQAQGRGCPCLTWAVLEVEPAHVLLIPVRVAGAQCATEYASRRALPGLGCRLYPDGSEGYFLRLLRLIGLLGW